MVNDAWQCNCTFYFFNDGTPYGDVFNEAAPFTLEPPNDLINTELTTALTLIVIACMLLYVHTIV